MLPKARRARSVNSTKLKPILQLYNKLCELVLLIGNLVSMESLTDIIILKVNFSTPDYLMNLCVLNDNIYFACDIFGIVIIISPSIHFFVRNNYIRNMRLKSGRN